MNFEEINERQLQSFVNIGVNEAEEIGLVYRFRRSGILEAPMKILKFICVHLFGVIRIAFLVWLMTAIQDTEVNTLASKNEKEWTLETLGIFVAFFSVVLVI